MARKTKKEAQAPMQAETSVNESVENATPQLTLADVKNAVNIMDYAAEQGAFKGWEIISQVMQVRQRLATFVEVASPKEEQNTEGEPAVIKSDDQPAEKAAN